MTSRIAVFLAAWFAALHVAALAAEPPTQPQLRIEPGTHAGQINGAAADAAGRFLVTASHDKTARVWSLDRGELLATLRPPSMDGAEGKLYAVAMSPSGALVAAGGWTRLGSESGNTVYVFDRASGRLLQNLTGMPDSILQLAFSLDGRYLAVALAGGFGIRLYDPSTGRLLGEAGQQTGTVHGIAWQKAASPVLISTHSDGRVRRWSVDASGRLGKAGEAAAPAGQAPHGIAISPDGQRVAVKYGSLPSVALLDAATLQPLRDQPSVESPANVFKLAWTDRKGRFALWAAGTHARYLDGRWQQVGVNWADGGDHRLAAPSETPLAEDTLMSLVALPDGQVAYASTAATWGVVDADGRRRLSVSASLRDFRSSRSGPLEVSQDGSSVRIGKLAFDAANRRLGATPNAQLLKPVGTAPNLDLRDWEDKGAPTLGGRPLPLANGETSRSRALRADGQGFVLGAEWSLRRFDAQGREVWNLPVPSVVWAVNLVEAGQAGWLVVAACGDGTIRWHRWSDGKELLALFAHADGKRWVLWTPSGYYDASPGAEDLIGYHVNRGKAQAGDFFPSARFRASLYRPDVIDRILLAQDEPAALKLADADAGRKSGAVVRLDDLGQKLPPVVTLLSPDSGSKVSSPSVGIKVQVRTAPDAPVTAIRVRVNGQPVELNGQRALKPKADGREAVETLTVSIPASDSEVTVFADNRHGTSTAASLKLLWAGKASGPAGEPEFVAKPKLYVLSVGVSNYRQADMRLRFAAKDAQDFADALQKQKGALYRDVVVKLLTDEKASRDEVLDGLEWLRKEVTQRDVGMVFLAGHGFNDSDGVFYYLPVEGDPDRIKRTGVVYNEIKNTLTNLAGKAIFFVDACHSGNVMGDGVRRRGQADMNFIVNELSSAENGVLVFASSTGRQFSLENTAWNNGAFTKALVEGLQGQADYNKNGRITHKMLDLYVSERVKELTKGQQTPKTLVPQGVTDFPVAVVR